MYNRGHTSLLSGDVTFIFIILCALPKSNKNKVYMAPYDLTMWPSHTLVNFFIIVIIIFTYLINTGACQMCIHQSLSEYPVIY